MIVLLFILGGAQDFFFFLSVWLHFVKRGCLKKINKLMNKTLQAICMLQSYHQKPVY